MYCSLMTCIPCSSEINNYLLLRDTVSQSSSPLMAATLESCVTSGYRGDPAVGVLPPVVNIYDVIYSLCSVYLECERLSEVLFIRLVSTVIFLTVTGCSLSLSEVTVGFNTVW